MTVRADERRRTDLVLEAAEAGTSLRDVLERTLAAIEEHLGYRESALMLTVREGTLPGRRAYGGLKHGSPPYVLEEYFERWADADPLASDAARVAYARHGRATLSSLYARLASPQRRFVDEFLRRHRTTEQLSYRLPAGRTDAYLTLMGADAYDEHDVDVVSALAAPLTRLLARHLPKGLDVRLSPREAAVAELVSVGLTNREIGAVLHVEEDTVKKHVSRAIAKVGVRHRTSLAVAWATGGRMDV